MNKCKLVGFVTEFAHSPLLPVRVTVEADTALLPGLLSTDHNPGRVVTGGTCMFAVEALP